MEEVWKPVKGFEGMYEVSNLGRVRGLDRLLWLNRTKTKQKKWAGRIIAPDVLKNGYYKIGLHKDGKKHLIALHRVVAEAFVEGKTAEKWMINHKDCNPANNRADNLEWCTCRYNNTYAGRPYKIWATRMANNVRYPNPPRAVEAWKDGQKVACFSSLREAAAWASRAPTAIMYCCKGVTKQCGGYHWKYSEE